MKKNTLLSLNQDLKDKGLNKWKKEDGYPKGFTALIEHLLIKYLKR